MRRRGGGAIVNVSSVQAIAVQRAVAAYAASKGAINALTRAMAVDHAHENIRVNTVCPASVDTPMLRRSAEVFSGQRTAEELVEEWGRMHPMGRVARPEEVAEVIVFLAGPRSSFVTGGEFLVDGGMLAALGVLLPEADGCASRYGANSEESSS
jgi:NAD(P)-dependent dehydrogenase (short-subunit alcohol dehydrogenase family)